MAVLFLRSHPLLFVPYMILAFTIFVKLRNPPLTVVIHFRNLVSNELDAFFLPLHYANLQLLPFRFFV